MNIYNLQIMKIYIHFFLLLINTHYIIKYIYILIIGKKKYLDQRRAFCIITTMIVLIKFQQ